MPIGYTPRAKQASRRSAQSCDCDDTNIYIYSAMRMMVHRVHMTWSRQLIHTR
jgi:hypothetical protein